MKSNTQNHGTFINGAMASKDSAWREILSNITDLNWRTPKSIQHNIRVFLSKAAWLDIPWHRAITDIQNTVTSDYLAQNPIVLVEIWQKVFDEIHNISEHTQFGI